MKAKYIIAVLVAIVASRAAATDLKVEPDLSHDLWWNAPETPCVKLAVSDTLGHGGVSVLEFYVTPDVDETTRVMSVKMPVQIPKGETDTLEFQISALSPGFYKCFVTDDGNLIKRFNIGYEPTNIVSLPDARADFDQFWQDALTELSTVAPNYTMVENKELSGKRRRVYDVAMQSLGGDTIRGQLYVPVKKGKYPALIYYNGYGSKPWEMNADDNPERVELVTGVRGQMFNEPYNKYGDWIRYNLGDPGNYYYRGAFMDTVRFLDFVEQLDCVDTSRIYAEGGSQGGALTLAAAALGGNRLKSIFVYVPFLSDYPDYFKIAPWPKSAVMEAAQEKGLSHDEVYRCLSYFDIKNLARRIECPVLMAIGLQDPICPPHTNLSSYNLITSPKELIIFPTCEHGVVWDEWAPRREKIISDNQ